MPRVCGLSCTVAEIVNSDRLELLDKVVRTIDDFLSKSQLDGIRESILHNISQL